MNNFRSKSFELLGVIYKDEALKRAERIFSSLYERWQAQRIRRETVLSEKDVILIAYGDSIISEEDKPLKTLKRFLDKHCREEITNVHLLPIYPSTSDDGFSVANYRQIDEKLGDWDNIEELSKDYGLMLDAVVNHSSKSHHWFKACLEGVEAYRDYYIAADPNADYSQVTRPRTSPLLTKFQTVEGEKYYWTTFSEDQVDLNYANPQVLAEVMDVLLFYAAKGAKVTENGGKISYKVNPDGSKSPYELNISYMDGITNPSRDKEERYKRFMASQAIMLSLQGVPGIYYHSLLGSGNWYEGVASSGINRKINRQKLNLQELTAELQEQSSLRALVFSGYKKLLKVRGEHSAFSPYASQKVLASSPSLFMVERYNENTGEKIIAVINLTGQTVKLDQPIKGKDLLSPAQGGMITEMKPYQISWILV